MLADFSNDFSIGGATQKHALTCDLLASISTSKLNTTSAFFRMLAPPVVGIVIILTYLRLFLLFSVVQSRGFVAFRQRKSLPRLVGHRIFLRGRA